MENLEALSGSAQSVLFQSLKRGDNPDKEEYCNTVAQRFWGIGQDSESGYHWIRVELTLSETYPEMAGNITSLKGFDEVEADGIDSEKKQRKTLLSEAPFRGPGECGIIATADLGLGGPSVDTRCACRESVVEDDTTQSAAD